MVEAAGRSHALQHPQTACVAAHNPARLARRTARLQQECAVFPTSLLRRRRCLRRHERPQPPVERLEADRPRTARQVDDVREQDPCTHLVQHAPHFVRVAAPGQKRQADIGNNAGPDHLQQARRIGRAHTQRLAARRAQRLADEAGQPPARVEGFLVAGGLGSRAEAGPPRVLPGGSCQCLLERTRHGRSSFRHRTARGAAAPTAAASRRPPGSPR